MTPEMRDVTLGTGAVWSDESKPIIHFGSPEQPKLPEKSEKPKVRKRWFGKRKN